MIFDLSRGETQPLHLNILTFNLLKDGTTCIRILRKSKTIIQFVTLFRNRIKEFIVGIVLIQITKMTKACTHYLRIDRTLLNEVHPKLFFSYMLVLLYPHPQMIKATKISFLKCFILAMHLGYVNVTVKVKKD